MNKRPDSYTFQRYLAAKRTVDDRALNQHVWGRLHEELSARVSASHPLTILEIGGGIGTMIDRLLAGDNMAPTGYHMLDEQPENIDFANTRVRQTFHTKQPGAKSPTFQRAPTHQLTWSSPTRREHTVNLYTSDLYDFLATAGSLAAVDLVLAHAFLDLIDIPATLPLFTATLSPGALIYATINFDGVTILEPAIDAAFDRHIIDTYHRTMDERITNDKPSGDSQTGRHLFHQLKTANIHTLDAGSSDWVVIPHHGSYPHDEAYFLHFIINTMHGALAAHPDIDAAAFQKWIATRHAQVEQGDLVYIAHQLDYLGQFQPDTAG